MHEIRFRGKRIDNGEWVYGYYFQGFTGISYILVLHDHILGMTEFYEVDPETVGQYTGLKDKNGYAELYEYDIIDSNGIKVGNYYENSYLLEGTVNLLIKRMGTKEWQNTKQEAIKRGCIYAE